MSKKNYQIAETELFKIAEEHLTENKYSVGRSICISRELGKVAKVSIGDCEIVGVLVSVESEIYVEYPDDLEAFKNDIPSRIARESLVAIAVDCGKPKILATFDREWDGIEKNTKEYLTRGTAEPTGAGLEPTNTELHNIAIKEALKYVIENDSPEACEGALTAISIESVKQTGVTVEVKVKAKCEKDDSNSIQMVYRFEVTINPRKEVEYIEELL